MSALRKGFTDYWSKEAKRLGYVARSALKLTAGPCNRRSSQLTLSTLEGWR